jgi:hypothetical protein
MIEYKLQFDNGHGKDNVGICLEGKGRLYSSVVVMVASGHVGSILTNEQKLVCNTRLIFVISWSLPFCTASLSMRILIM